MTEFRCTVDARDDGSMTLQLTPIADLMTPEQRLAAFIEVAVEQAHRAIRAQAIQMQYITSARFHFYLQYQAHLSAMNLLQGLSRP